MKIALIGSRGIPARYSGFEQFYEQFAVRLAKCGHEVTVYNRSHFIKDVKKEYQGVRIVSLPSIPTKHLDTITHTALSTLHAMFQGYDVVYYCIVGNSPLVWLPRLVGAKTLINVDGEDWAREKWSGFARLYQKWCERVACRAANVVIADAKGILKRYRDLYGHETIFVPYGANVRNHLRGDARFAERTLQKWELEPDEYILYVGRFVPENAIDLLIRSYRRVETNKKLVIVGDAPYAADYKRQLESLAADDSRVVFTGYAFGEAYEALSANTYLYVQPSGVEGTRPALLDQLGFGNAVLVRNSEVNMEVIRDAGAFFDRSAPETSLQVEIQRLVDEPQRIEALRGKAVTRIETFYNWEWVTSFYEHLLERVFTGQPLIQYGQYVDSPKLPAATPVQQKAGGFAWINKLAQAVPVTLFTLLLLALLVVRLVNGVVLPIWMAWGVGLLWGLVAFGYLARFEVFKQIGGLFSVFVGLGILVGALAPLDRVQQYPQLTSDQLIYTFESTWNAVYQGNFFEGFSPKQLIADSLRGFGTIDPFRGGKMLLFAILGFAMSASFLFPYAPVGRPDRSSRHTYLRRLLAVSGIGMMFALHVELLQVLTPTRTVAAFNAAENMLGLLAGMVAFLPVQFMYSALAIRRKVESPRFNVLGVGVDAVNMEDCLQRFEKVIGGPPIAPQMACALGVAGIVSARRDPVLQRILNRSILNTPDGMPLVWLGRLYGYPHIERVYGPDLLRDVCAYSADKGWTHYFYGAAPGIVEKLKMELEKRHPSIRIVGIKCPPFRPLTAYEESTLIEEVDRCKPDIFWIGISTPKQLYLMDELRHKLNCKIICPVGYAFDVNAGVEVDAPDWIKYSGLQWLHRGIKQPRLWKRYLPDNPRFVAEVLLQILRIKKYPMESSDRA